MMGLKQSLGKYMKLFLYLIAIVLINLAGMTLFFRIDLTRNHTYSLSPASKAVVSTLSEPLTINVFFTRNLPAPHNQTEQYLRDLLEEYAIHANTYFNYRFYNVNPESDGLDREAQENQKLADDYGIHPIQIQLIEKDEVKFKRAYMGLVLIHGDLVERIPTITSTDGLEYQLTTSIQKLNHKISAFLNLTRPIDIKLFLSSSLKPVAPFMGIEQLSEFPQDLEAIVKKLNKTLFGKLSYRYFDPSKEADMEKEIAAYHLMTLKWPALAGGKVTAGSGVIGLVMSYGDKVLEIPLIHVLKIPLIGTRYDLVDTQELEEIIGTSIERLININEDLGYLADHGTPGIGGSGFDQDRSRDRLAAFSQLVSRNYAIKPVSLKKETIPEGLKCLLIAGPTETFSDDALYQIDQALMRGTNLAIFLDAFKEAAPPKQAAMGFQQPPQFVPLDTGLQKLLNHYGIQMKQSLIMDESCFRQRVPSQYGGGEQPLYFAPLIQPKFINDTLAFMKNIKGLVCLKVSPLETDAKRLAQSGITAVRLFATSDASWEMSDRINLNPMMIRPPQSREDQKSFDVAYLLEGEFSSYFAGKPIPERVIDAPEVSENGQHPDEAAKTAQDTAPKGLDLSKIEEKGGFREKGKSGKIILISSSEMLKDNILDPEGSSPNSTLILNMLDVLNDREEIAVMRGKELRFNPLYDTGALTKTAVKTLNIAGVPVLVILFGCMVYWRRRAKRKRIQMLFQS